MQYIGFAFVTWITLVLALERYDPLKLYRDEKGKRIGSNWPD